MLVIPVIDIKGGKSVRMVEGLADKTIYYSESPLNMAKLFRKENAKMIHITDLDGAFTGMPMNYDMIKHIVDEVGVPVQLGGGIRSLETAARVIDELGVYRIVLGTSAIDDIGLIHKLIEKYTAHKIVIGVDVRSGYLVKDGWRNVTDIPGVEFASRLRALGIERIIYQDVGRVGTCLGPDIEALQLIAQTSKLKVTAAGGIGGYPDLRAVQDLEKFGVDSVMISRALYENRFPCQAIWREIEKVDVSLDLPKVN